MIDTGKPYDVPVVEIIGRGRPPDVKQKARLGKRDLDFVLKINSKPSL